MRNWKTSKRQIIRKSTKTDDVLTIFFQNINSILEKATTLNTIGTSWTDSTDRSTDKVAIYSKLQIRDKNETNILKYSNINKYKKKLTL